MSEILADRLAQLPKYYTHKDVLTILFADDEDAFLDAYCSGDLPAAVRHACEDTMGEALLGLWLQRRQVRLLKLLVDSRAPTRP